ncbi:ATP-binding protein [Kitasatospora sp. NPDC054939]
MTQIALAALAVVAVAALAAAAVTARARRHATARAHQAEAERTRAEEQTREAYERVREAEQRADRAEERARGAEDETRRAEGLTRFADQRTRAAEEHTQALLAEITHLARERVPATALRLGHPNAPLAGPLDDAAIGPDAVHALQAVLDACATAVTDERERVDAAARAAMRGATSRIQTLLYQLQSLLQQLQHEHDDPRLLEADFRNEVALRRIQTIAVLCEAWPGLARSDSPLAEVVVGALSRVPGYARIKVANHLRENRLAVTARAAEPIAVTVAELLANATAYSHPETEVPVTIQQGGRSALVIVDDSGIGMEEDQLRRARRLLAGPTEVLLTELGNPPKTGFAVVGKLARQYGFACHIEPSPYGGMRTIVRIPAALLTVVDEEQPLSVLTPLPLRPPGTAEAAALPAARADRPGPPAAPAASVPAQAPSPVADGSGLPSRRRRQPLRAEAEHPVAGPAPAAGPQPAGGLSERTPDRLPERTPEQAAARWQALQQGTGSGRAAVAEADQHARTGPDDPAAPDQATPVPSTPAPADPAPADPAPADPAPADPDPTGQPRAGATAADPA